MVIFYGFWLVMIVVVVQVVSHFELYYIHMYVYGIYVCIYALDCMSSLSLKGNPKTTYVTVYLMIHTYVYELCHHNINKFIKKIQK